MVGGKATNLGGRRAHWIPQLSSSDVKCDETSQQCGLCKLDGYFLVALAPVTSPRKTGADQRRKFGQGYCSNLICNRRYVIVYHRILD